MTSNHRNSSGGGRAVRDLLRGSLKVKLRKSYGGTLPAANMQKARHMALLGLSVPEEYGGPWA